MTDALALLSGMPDPEKVRALEAQMLAMQQVEIETHHFLHGGLSARTIMVPAGTMLTGVQTNIDNVCIVCGDITVTTDKGPQRLTGFNVIPAGAGFKRAGIAHEDTWWTTIHRTDLTDLKAVEDEMSAEAGKLQTRRGLEYRAPESLEA